MIQAVKKAILHIGSNLGEREINLQQARQKIENQAGRIQLSSSIYQTAAWGIEEQAAFLNQALLIETRLPPIDLLNTVLEIEQIMGRIRIEKWGERLIDIDIVFYENQIINLPKLTIPHPLMQERNFVLAPLKDIIPTWKHPILQKSVLELYHSSPDSLEVERFS